MTPPAMQPFVVATGNPDKAREIVEIFSARGSIPLAAAVIEARDGAPIGFVCASLDEIGAVVGRIARPEHAPDVAEIGTTLEANARIKAVGVATALGVPAIADDTGLEVDALGGAPGVRSARFAGPDATSADNCDMLLTEMRLRMRASRTARFVTIVIRHDPATGAETVVRGTVEGVIVDEPRGDHGFGYDPVFAPAGGAGRTFGEMTADEKHAISHRGRAFRALAAALAGED